MLVGSLAALVLLIWMVLKIWKQSAVLAVVVIFFSPALIYALFKFWGDEESDIKVPFFLFVMAVGYMYYDTRQMAKDMKEEDARITAMRYVA